jgi:hypothetical protein
MRILLALAILVAVGLFILGLVAPRRSRQAQRRIERPLRRAERATDKRGGRPGDWTNTTLSWVRQGLGRAASAGRGLRDRL